MSLFSFDRFVQEADFAERSRLLSELDGIVNRRRPVVERVAQCFSALVSRHGVETQQHGSWTQDLALPDSDVDISCPEDPYLAGTRRALESPLNTSFLVEESVSEWRLLVRHWQTGVQLDVTQKAAHRTEPHWKAEHIRRSISWACDGNVRSAVLILKLWVRKHAEKFQPKNGYPNSYTFLLIFLFLCTHRERPVIPILSCKQDSSGSGGLSILRLARPSSLRLHSEDPLVLVQEFLGFLVSNLRGMQVDFDNDRKRKIPTSLEGSAEQAAKVWSVKEPFTGIIKCQTRGWVERVRPDIVARAQKDFFVISFASTGHVRRNAAEAFPSDLHRSGPTAPLGPGSHLSFPLTHFAAESPPPQQHRSEGSGFESLEAKFPPPFLTQHHPERHEPGSLFPSTPDWQREWHGLSQLYVQPHLQYQAQQHRYGQYHPYAPFHQMQVVYPFEGRADGFAVPPDYPAVQDLIPLSFDLSQQAWSGIVGSLGGRGKNGDLFTLGVGSQVPTGEVVKFGQTGERVEEDTEGRQSSVPSWSSSLPVKPLTAEPSASSHRLPLTHTTPSAATHSTGNLLSGADAQGYRGGEEGVDSVDTATHVPGSMEQNGVAGSRERKNESASSSPEHPGVESQALSSTSVCLTPMKKTFWESASESTEGPREVELGFGCGVGGTAAGTETELRNPFAAFVFRTQGRIPRGSQTLCLRGKSENISLFRPSTRWQKRFRSGKASHLRTLDLEATDLREESLQALCDAIVERSLQIETLNLSSNQLGGPEMSVLCSVLRKVSLSRLRSLLLRNCRLRQLEVGPLVDCLETGCLSRLETLDLERSLAWEIGGVNREESGEGIEGGGGEQISVLKMLIGILRVDALPCLKNLNLMSEYGWKSKREVEAFLAVLRSDECPPLEHLKLHLKDLGEDHVRALGGGEYPSIRTLCLSLSPHNVVVFLSAFVANVEGRQFEVLDFKLWPESSEKSQQEVAGEGLRLLSAAVEMARPACLRKLSVRGPVADSAQNVRGLFDAFTLVRPPTLTHLELTHCVCSDEVMFLLAKAVGKGHLPTLRVLVLSKLKPQGGQSTRVFGAVGMQALMEAVVRNPEGLLFLERLDVSETGGGVKPGALGKALVTAKLGRLWHINLSDSCLSDDGVKGLAAAAQKGGMYRVTELLLGGNPSVGQGRWSSLEAAVAKHAPHLRQFAKRERTQQTVYTELDDEKVPMKGKEGARECDRVSDGVSSTPEQVQLPVTVSEEGSDALSPKLGDVFQGSAETVAAEKAEEVTLHEENEEDFRVSYNDAIVAGFARLRGFGDRRAESSLSHQTSGDGIKPKRDQLGEGKSA